jgi:hypothetical protein
VHVLTGYEARPAGMQLVFWVVTFAILAAGMGVVSSRMTAQRERANRVSKRVSGGAAITRGA